MVNFLIRRLILLVFVLFGVTVLVFGILMSFTPERRAAAFVSSPQQARDIPQLVKQYGLNDPFYQQYWRWLKNVLQGNMGWSAVASDTVWNAFFRYVPISFELVLYSSPLFIIAGIWFGTLAGVYRDSWIDHVSRITSIIGWSLPGFLLALIMLMIFYGFFRGWFPPGILSDKSSMYIADPSFILRGQTLTKLSHEGIPADILAKLDSLKDREYHASFTLTEESLARLAKEGIPDMVLTKLENLKNRDYLGYQKKENFLRALEHSLGSEQTNQFKAIISKYVQYSAEEKFLTALKEAIGSEQLDLYRPLLLKDARFHTFTHYTGMNTIDGILNGELWITLDAFRHLVLPVFSVVIALFALLVRVMRSGMIEALSQDYIITAKAKGADQDTINKKHARRNAMIPVLTIAGVLIAQLMAGFITIEVVFTRQGMGWWLARSAVQLDIPALLAVCLFIGFVFVIANLIVDILYAYIDPRILIS